MTQSKVIGTPKSVQTPFCQAFSQICYTTIFAATNFSRLSDLLSARGLVHSHRIADLFLVSFSARGLAHCRCQLQHALSPFALCCVLYFGIHICTPPYNSIQFLFQLVCGVSFWSMRASTTQ